MSLTFDPEAPFLESVLGRMNGFLYRCRADKEFTMLELAEHVIRLVGSRSKLVFKPLPQDDPKQRKPVIDLAQSKLDWTPKVSLEDGLKSTIDYFRRALAS